MLGIIHYSIRQVLVIVQQLSISKFVEKICVFMDVNPALALNQPNFTEFIKAMSSLDLNV